MNKYLSFPIIILLLISCTTKIEDLKNNPVYYAGKEVNVSGKITKIVNIPLTNYSFFELKDISDNIIVLTTRDYNLKEEVNINANVVALDTSNNENNSLNVIRSIEKMLIREYNVDEKGVKLTAEAISYYLTGILDALEATYFLLERD